MSEPVANSLPGPWIVVIVLAIVVAVLLVYVIMTWWQRRYAGRRSGGRPVTEYMELSERRHGDRRRPVTGFSPVEPPATYSRRRY